MIPAALLVIAGVVSCVLYLFVFVDPTDEEDWASAGQFVMENLGEDDLVRAHPHWATGPLVHVQGARERVDVVSRPVWEDYHGVETIWLMADASREDEALALLPFEAEPKRHAFGTVTVLEVESPVGELPYVFHEQLVDAKVERIDKAGKATECATWNPREERWDCGRRDRWFYVGRELKEIGDEPRECVWAHPLSDGRWLHVTFPDVPAGGELVLKAGQTLRGQRSARGTDIFVVIDVGGDRVVDERISHRDPTYHTWRIPNDAAEPRSVTFKLSSISARDRFFCIDGFVTSVDTAGGD